MSHKQTCTHHDSQKINIFKILKLLFNVDELSFVGIFVNWGVLN